MAMRNAFTLIELLVTVVINVWAALLFPAFARTGQGTGKRSGPATCGN